MQITLFWRNAGSHVGGQAVDHIGGSVSGYHELMTSLTAQRSPATVRRTGSRAVFSYIADRVENSLFCRSEVGANVA
jgi:hypothetical protein